MSQTLILELSDDVYTIIQRQAEGAGTSPAQWLAMALERQYHVEQPWPSTAMPLPMSEHHTAQQRFEQHFGEVDLAEAVGVDNEQIDRELAQTYTDTHEAPSCS